MGIVEVFEIVGFFLLFCSSDTDSSEFVRESHLLIDTVHSVIDGYELEDEDCDHRDEAAANEDA